jgi:hypothetical protein
MCRASARDLKGNNTQEDAEMSSDIKVGDHVRLINLPEWLTHDLPVSEQAEMQAFIGKTAAVEKIDNYGYFWIGFGALEEVGDDAYYSGHSFGVPRDCIEPAARVQRGRAKK